MVLVVPETPSGYLDPSTFHAAMSYARQLNRRSPLIRVLGPFASGTVPALRKLIDEWRNDPEQNRRDVEFDIVSGSATARETLAQLSRNAPYVRFHSVIYDDETALSALRSHFGWEAPMVLLSESGTAYGAQRLWISSIRFPREIGRLRNAYGQLPAVTAPGSRLPLPTGACCLLISAIAARHRIPCEPFPAVSWRRHKRPCC